MTGPRHVPPHRIAPDVMARGSSRLDAPGAVVPVGAPGQTQEALPANPQRGRGPLSAIAALLSPDQFQPAGATPVYAQATAAVAGPASWVVPAAIVTRLPSGSIGVIKDFGITITNMLVTSAVTWQLRVNGQPVSGGPGSVTIAARAAAYVEATPFNFSLTVRVPEGAQLDVMITVADAGAYVVGAYYVGWFYPRRYAEQYDRIGV